jgi:hypothetical protein
MLFPTKSHLQAKTRTMAGLMLETFSDERRVGRSAGESDVAALRW